MKKLLSIIAAVLTLAMLFGACGTKDNSGDSGKTVSELSQKLVDEAADVVYEYNKPGENNTVATDFTLPSKLVDYEGQDLDVEWTLEGGDGLVALEQGTGDKVNVRVNGFADSETTFAIKGRVKGGEFTSKEIVLNYKIGAFEIADWAYWAENTKDATMNIRGVVVAKYPFNEANKNVSVFLQDLDGEHGYFAYRLKCETQEACDTDLAVGNVIIVNGTTSIYNGFREMGTGCTYTVVKDGSGNVQTAEVVKKSIDEFFTEGANLDKVLDQYQGIICRISGAKVKSIDWNTNNADNYEEKGAGSVYITVTKNNVDFKLYLSTSNTLTLSELKAEYEKVAVGYVIDVEGPMSWYNGAQIYPCAGGITVSSTDISNEEKISNALAALTLPSVVNENTEIDLPGTAAEYSDVKFEWTSSDETLAAVKDGKLAVTVGEKTQKVNVTVKATCGSDSAEQVYEILVVPGEMTAEDILDLAYSLKEGEILDGTYTLTGVVTSVDTAYNEQYENVTVTIVANGHDDKPMMCYRMKGAGSDVVKVGDTITVTGNIKNYKGTIEFDAGCTLDNLVPADSPADPTDKPEEPTQEPEVTPGPTEPAELTPGQILDILYALEKGKSTTESYTLSGTIKSVDTPYNSSYQNVTVTIVVDGYDSKPVQCYRLKGNGADTIKVGDKITVTGKFKNYNGKYEFDEACTLDSIDYVAEAQTNAYTTTEEILKALYALSGGQTLDNGNTYTLTGKITSIDTAWSDQYKNITVTIVCDGFDDYPVMCYRLEGDGASELKVGDVITVSGSLKKYHNNNDNSDLCEFNAGCKIVK